MSRLLEVGLLFIMNSFGKLDLSLCLPRARLTMDHVFFYIEFIFFYY